MVDAHGDRRLQVLLRQLACCQSSDSTIIVVGGAVLDIQAQPDGPDDLRRGTSVPGKVQQLPGGVGRNIAEALSHLLQHPLPPPKLLSLLGDDAAGTFLRSTLQSLRLDLSLVAVREGMRTPCVLAALEQSGEVAACVADVASLEQQLTPSLITQLLTGTATPPQPPDPRRAAADAPSPAAAAAGPIHSAALLIVEANLSSAAIAAACEAAVEAGVPIFLEPVSIPKSTRCVPVLRHLTYIKPNSEELRAIAQAVRSLPPVRREPQLKAAPAEASCSGRAGSAGAEAAAPDEAAALGPALARQVQHAAVLLEAGVRYVVLTDGARGAALLCTESTALSSLANENLPQGPQLATQQQQRQGCQGASVSHAAPEASRGGSRRVHVARMQALPADVVNLSGAGDTLVAGMAAALLRNTDPVEALAYGMAAAQLAVQCHCNVPHIRGFDSLRGAAARALSTVHRCTVSVPLA